MPNEPWHRGRQLPLARRAGQGGVSGGELGEQHGDVVVEPVSGMRAEPIQQLVGGRLQVGQPERLDLLVQPEELASAVPGLQQPVGEEDQPVAGAHRERGQVQVRVQAQRACERRRIQRPQLTSVVSRSGDGCPQLTS